MPDQDTHHPKPGAGLLLGTLGIVCGDIGTSPIYIICESLKSAGVGAAQDPAAAGFGVLSMVVWTVLIVVTLKYVVLAMRADNDGEGGIVALIPSERVIELGTQVEL